MMSDKVQESIAEALAQLQEERARIEGAIAKLEGCLEHLVASTTASVRSYKALFARSSMKKHRTATEARGRSREGWTPKARLAAAQRMRLYWEKRRVDQASGNAPVRRQRATQPGQSTTATPRERSVSGWTAEKREAARTRMQQYWLSRKQASQG